MRKTFDAPVVLDERALVEGTLVSPGTPEVDLPEITDSPEYPRLPWFRRFRRFWNL